MTTTTATRILKCNSDAECLAPVTHIHKKGWILCTNHGEGQTSCRKLRGWELRRLERGEPVPRY